jgi:hypothetical protein
MNAIMEQEVTPPRDGKGQKITVSTTGARTALDATVLGVGWLRIKAVTADVDILLGGEDVAIPTYGAAGTSGVGYPISAGTWEEFYITSDTHISWDASAAGLLVLWRMGRERTGK